MTEQTTRTMAQRHRAEINAHDGEDPWNDLLFQLDDLDTEASDDEELVFADGSRLYYQRGAQFGGPWVEGVRSVGGQTVTW
ncbi:MAG: hypothetical protein AB1416_08335 [Actinomycetota bacterium]